MFSVLGFMGGITRLRARESCGPSPFRQPLCGPRRRSEGSDDLIIAAACLRGRLGPAVVKGPSRKSPQSLARQPRRGRNGRSPTTPSRGTRRDPLGSRSRSRGRGGRRRTRKHRRRSRLKQIYGNFKDLTPEETDQIQIPGPPDFATEPKCLRDHCACNAGGDGDGDGDGDGGW